MAPAPEAGKQAGRQAGRRADKQIGRQAGRQADRQACHTLGMAPAREAVRHARFESR